MSLRPGIAGAQRLVVALGSLALALGVLSQAAPSAAQARAPQGAEDEPERSGNRTDYRIQARLEGATTEPKRLTGKATIDWTNGSGEAVSDLWFHLYLNAFSNNQSTHLFESRGKLRGVEIEEGWGWSEIKTLRVAEPGSREFEDVFPSFRYRRPEDGRAEDRTVFSVDLPRPVESGETLRIEVEWVSQLPRVRRRTGYKDDFLLVAQWFPKLGVYEAGSGWNCHQFHMNTEFFSDYGFYDVTLDLPARFHGKVGGSGRLEVERLEQGNRTIARFVAPSRKDQTRTDATGRRPVVHDFTWTADPRYVVYNDHFRFKEWAERFPGEVEEAQRVFGSDKELELRNVDVTVLIHPEREEQAYRHFQATCAALFFYGLWFGEYPYEHITVVDPAWGARAAGGMEYPTLFTCGTQIFTTEDMYVPESVTVHEAGHQFWYGLVGNNEFEAAWLDEGLNSYADSEVLYRVYGPRRATTRFARIPVNGVRLVDTPSGDGLIDTFLAREIPMPWIVPNLNPIVDSGFLSWWRDQPKLSFVPQWTDPRWSDRSGYLRDPATDPIDTKAWEYADRDSYRTNSYPRPAVALRSLAAVIGRPAFLRGMREFSETWRYRHPYPEDFYRSFQDSVGSSIDWYFREIFQGTGTVDWSVTVEQTPRARPRGFFQGEGGTFIERQVDEEDLAEQRPWRIEILLRREGELQLPLPVRLRFADGSTREEIWTREEQSTSTWKRLAFESDEKLVAVQMDPDRGYYIDSDMSNNAWYDQAETLTSWRWGERAMVQFQRYFHWIAGLGG